ncbi:MAG: hypothetical protein WCO03_00585, partial [bacterium]
VSLDTVLPVKLGKEVKLRLYYTGNALDLRNLNAEKVPLNKHHLLIEAKNESGAVVARHETDIDFNQNDNYLVNSLASNSAKELSVSILVTGGTTTLAEYKTVFKQGVKTEINWVLWTKIIFLFILLIILLALLKMRSKRIDLSSPTSGVIAALLLLIVPLTIFAGWIKIESRQYRGEVAPITTVTANVSPADPSSDLPLKHGEGFFIRGNVFAPACNNHSQGVRYTPEYLNRVYAPIFKGGYEMDKTIDDSRVVNKSCRWVDFDHDGIKETLHCMFNRYLDFSIGAVPGQPFFAPLTGNSSEIKLKIDNMWMEWVKDADLTADHIVVYSDSKSAESLAYATLSMIRGRIPFTMRGDVPDDIKVSCSVSPNQVALGGSAEWSALVASGTPPYEYHWVFDGVPITANYVSPYSKTYTTAGSKTAKLSVKDSVGKWSAQVDCTNGVNVVPPPTLNVECDGTITNLTSRQVNWRVNKIDGVVINEGNAGAYSYNWSGTDELSGTSYFVDKIYASFGNKLGRVAVQNSAGVAGSCEKVVTLTDSSCTNPPCNSCTRTCPDGYSGPDGCGGTCVPVTPPVCDDSCTGHVCGNTNECGTVCGSPSDSGCSVVTHNKLFCLNFSGLGGLNGDRLNIVEPQKFPVSKTFKVKACECTGAGCLTCTDCSTPYGGTVEVSVPQLGDWAKIISKQASKCSTEEQPSLLPVTIEANSVAGADMTLIFPTRCANNNEASAYNSNPEWNISVSGYDKDYISNKGEGSFKVYFVSSQGSNK